METVAEGLWSLADRWEEEGRVGQAVKCLEAICQSHVSFLPITDVKTRLRIASLLLRHTDNVSHAKSHLERAVRIFFFSISHGIYRCYHVDWAPVFLSLIGIAVTYLSLLQTLGAWLRNRSNQLKKFFH